MLLFLALLLLALFPVRSALSDHVACSRPVLPMPRTVLIRPDVPGGPQPWLSAIATWNASHPGINMIVLTDQSAEADVYIINSNVWSDGTFWVDIPCNRIESVVYVGNSPPSSQWATHELGHTLGLADHIPAGASTQGYLNPGVCGVAVMPYSPYGIYQGIMSYCSNSWSPLFDGALVNWWF